MERCVKFSSGFMWKELRFQGKEIQELTLQLLEEFSIYFIRFNYCFGL